MLTSLDEYFFSNCFEWLSFALHLPLGHYCDFLSTNISQGSVATRVLCGGTFNYCFIRNLLLSLPAKKQEGQHELTGQRAENFRRDLEAT